MKAGKAGAQKFKAMFFCDAYLGLDFEVPLEFTILKKAGGDRPNMDDITTVAEGYEDK